ncbi:TPA: hypothetical protein ACH3X2_003878 [Trebouxia sp. C0005]
MPVLGSVCPVSCQVDRRFSFVFRQAEGALEGLLEIAPDRFGGLTSVKELRPFMLEASDARAQAV